MAAHRFTNLATIHLDIPVHFMKTNKAGIIYKAYANDGVTFPADGTGGRRGPAGLPVSGQARRVFEQPDWTKPYQQYTDTPWRHLLVHCVAEQGEREAFSVSVGTPYEHVKWFRGRGTQHRSKSRCPDPTCCTLPPPAARRSLDGGQLAQCAGALGPCWRACRLGRSQGWTKPR
jgi:hypothetical protein